MSKRNKFVASAIIFFLFLNFGFAQDTGLASYYGDAFHGSQTANGEIYDRTKMTAAHRTYPFGTLLKVTRTDNKKSVVVKVNDRGPHIKGRIVDVSKEAAKKLGLIRDGVAKVTVEKVTSKSAATTTPAAKATEAKIPSEAPPAVVDDSAAKKAEEARIAKEIAAQNQKERDEAAKKAATAAAEKAALEAKAKEAKSVVLKEPKLVSLKNYSEYGLYKIQVMKPEKKGFGVQVASITNHENMLKQIAHFQGKHFKNILTSIEKGASGTTVYKIILGPFPDQKTAQSYKRSLGKKHKVKGFVVSLESPNN